MLASIEDTEFKPNLPVVRAAAAVLLRRRPRPRVLSPGRCRPHLASRL